jgi:hypothetical protein
VAERQGVEALGGQQVEGDLDEALGGMVGIGSRHGC